MNHDSQPGFGAGSSTIVKREISQPFRDQERSLYQRDHDSPKNLVNNKLRANLHGSMMINAHVLCTWVAFLLTGPNSSDHSARLFVRILPCAMKSTTVSCATRAWEMPVMSIVVRRLTKWYQPAQLPPPPVIRVDHLLEIQRNGPRVHDLFLKVSRMISPLCLKPQVTSNPLTHVNANPWIDARSHI